MTAQVAAAVPVQVPPVQTYEEAAGLQLAVSVLLAPAATVAGAALKVQTGVAKLRAKVAVTFCAALMLTTQLPVPVHAPLQPVKLLPAADVAVRVTLAPVVKDALQLVPQLMPAGVLVIVPEPVPLRATLSVTVAADTVTAALADVPIPPAFTPATV